MVFTNSVGGVSIARTRAAIIARRVMRPNRSAPARGRHVSLGRCEVHTSEFCRFGRIGVRCPNQVNKRRARRNRRDERRIVEGVADHRECTGRESV